MDWRAARKAIFPTSHRIILEARLKPIFAALEGEVLICGAGSRVHDGKLGRATRVVASDIDPDCAGIDIVADIHALPFEGECFDAVMAIEVFEHITDPVKAASEILRVLRPGGRALVSVPFLFHIHADPHDFTRFTLDGLRGLFGDFSRVTVDGYGSRMHVISDIVSTANKPAVLLRLANHMLCAGPLKSVTSADCPSGYIVQAWK